MQVSSYLFQSPYPQQVQFGTTDPVAQSQQTQQDNSTQIAQTPTTTQQQAGQYQYTATSQTGSSVNVAASSTNVGVATSLETFTAASNQMQAAQAYTTA